jgi:Tfp pilus assembly protein FimT
MHAEPPKVDPPKRKRRWFQYSLRSLLIVVAIAAVQCAVCLPLLREWQQRRQQQADSEELIKLITDTVVPSTGLLTVNETSRDGPKRQSGKEGTVSGGFVQASDQRS